MLLAGKEIDAASGAVLSAVAVAGLAILKMGSTDIQRRRRRRFLVLLDCFLLLFRKMAPLFRLLRTEQSACDAEREI